MEDYPVDPLALALLFLVGAVFGTLAWMWGGKVLEKRPEWWARGWTFAIASGAGVAGSIFWVYATQQSWSSGGDAEVLMAVAPAIIFLPAALVLAATDAAAHTLPNRLVFAGLALQVLALAGVLGVTNAETSGWTGPAYDVTALWEVFARGLASGLIAFAVVLIMALASNSVGMGDVKLAAPLGVALGVRGWYVLGFGFAAGFLLAGAWALYLILAKRAEAKTQIALGPWLIFGAYLAWFLPI